MRVKVLFRSGGAVLDKREFKDIESCADYLAAGDWLGDYPKEKYATLKPIIFINGSVISSEATALILELVRIAIEAEKELSEIGQ